ncbi:MAG: chorismate synthase, partial [Peptococcaceae bacterium]|nr:chorismate synthase [Peptococcaceae bacterium]
VHIASGIMDGVTTGFPLMAYIENTNQHSKDYSNLLDHPRPSHADYTAHIHYKGFADMRGGGHFSGRLTAPLCIAGGIAKQILRRRGIHVGAQLLQIENIIGTPFDAMNVDAETLESMASMEFPTIDEDANSAMQAAIQAAAAEGDSVGGVVQGAIIGVPVGLGGPMFDGIENRMAQALFGIPGCKGVSFGAGFDAVTMRGSVHNDPFIMKDGNVTTTTNHAGGILGGITSGAPITVQIAMKPTASISIEQQTVSLSKHADAPLVVTGRHDPCIAVRTVPVLEAVMAIVILDLLLEEHAL